MRIRRSGLAARERRSRPDRSLILGPFSPKRRDRETQTVLKARPDRMLNHQLPHHRAQLAGENLGVVAVLLRWSDMQDPTRADENARAASVFNEGDLLRVEEAERGLRIQMGGETVQQRLLVFAILHPRLAEISKV